MRKKLISTHGMNKSAKKKIQVFSPHFDDAILSCGQHMLHWVKDGCSVEVVTVFTEFSATVLSDDSRNFLHASAAQSTDEMRSIRSAEDATAMRALGVKYRWLGHIDGGFRERDGQPVYPTHAALFSGEIRDDRQWMKKLGESLRAVIDPQATVVVPLGVGSHADHIVVGELVTRFVTPTRLLQYIDMPYGFQADNWRGRQLRQVLMKNKSFLFDSDEKRALLDHYASQLDGLFFEKGYNLFELVLGKMR